jgi:hypothetical protein
VKHLAVLTLGVAAHQVAIAGVGPLRQELLEDAACTGRWLYELAATGRQDAGATVEWFERAWAAGMPGITRSGTECQTMVCVPHKAASLSYCQQVSS